MDGFHKYRLNLRTGVQLATRWHALGLQCRSPLYAVRISRSRCPRWLHVPACWAGQQIKSHPSAPAEHLGWGLTSWSLRRRTPSFAFPVSCNQIEQRSEFRRPALRCRHHWSPMNQIQNAFPVHQIQRTQGASSFKNEIPNTLAVVLAVRDLPVTGAAPQANKHSFGNRQAVIRARAVNDSFRC